MFVLSQCSDIAKPTPSFINYIAKIQTSQPYQVARLPKREFYLNTPTYQITLSFSATIYMILNFIHFIRKKKPTYIYFF